MLFNKEKRIKYLGFNDFWFVVIGILTLSFITDYLFNNSFGTLPFGKALLSWSISLFFTICNWFIVRPFIIILRKKYPHLKDVIKRLPLVFLAVVGTVLLVDLFGNKLISLIFGAKYHKILSSSQVLLPIIIISTMTMAIYETIYYYTKLKKSIREEEQAKQVIVKAQLDALRNQAQPHFLFNSLNTLRDIIDQNPKEDAKKFVDKLSDVYRFILDAGNTNLIPLRDEMRFARAYIHIQKERFGDNLMLDWSIPETMLDTLIVPMSLQLLLENAIKHNVVSKAKPLVIRVSVNDSNLVVDNIKQPKSTQIPSTKLGLKNIQKRYALISDISPRIENGENRFMVFLPLLTATNQKSTYENIDH
ncbi:MAG: histidine kinase [Bacteroidota bacterium]